MVIEFDDAQEIEFSSLEYVIHLGSQGNHILFDKDRIREAFANREDDLSDLGSDVVTKVRKAISDVFSIPDFEGKRDYIASLPGEVQDVIIYLYFQMIEKSMLLDQSQYH